MTKKFNESLEDTDLVVMASPTSKRQHASNGTVEAGPQCLLDATSLTAPTAQHQEGRKRAMLERWQPILSNVIMLAFFGTSILLSIKCGYLFFEELSSVYFIIALLLLLKHAGEKGHAAPNLGDDSRQPD